MSSQKRSQLPCVFYRGHGLMACHAYFECWILLWYSEAKLPLRSQRWRCYSYNPTWNNAWLAIFPWKQIDSQRYQSRKHSSRHGRICVYKWFWSFSIAEEGVEEKDLRWFSMLDGPRSNGADWSWPKCGCLVSRYYSHWIGSWWSTLSITTSDESNFANNEQCSAFPEQNRPVG